MKFWSRSAYGKAYDQRTIDTLCHTVLLWVVWRCILLFNPILLAAVVVARYIDVNAALKLYVVAACMDAFVMSLFLAQ